MKTSSDLSRFQSSSRPRLQVLGVIALSVFPCFGQPLPFSDDFQSYPAVSALDPETADHDPGAPWTTVESSPINIQVYNSDSGAGINSPSGLAGTDGNYLRLRRDASFAEPRVSTTLDSSVTDQRYLEISFRLWVVGSSAPDRGFRFYALALDGSKVLEFHFRTDGRIEANESGSTIEIAAPDGFTRNQWVEAGIRFDLGGSGYILTVDGTDHEDGSRAGIATSIATAGFAPLDPGATGATFTFIDDIAVRDLRIVTNANDSGPGSLREAIAAATAGSTLTFDRSLSGQTITLGGTQLTIDTDLAIDASGLPGGITISGDVTGDGPSPDDSRIFEIASGTTAALDGVVLSGGDAGQGGAILNRGTLTVTGSTLSGNRATTEGGGIYNDAGSLTLENVTLSGNSAGEGGGIWNAAGIGCSLTNCTVTGNLASFHAGIANDNGSVALAHCTLAGNAAVVMGGGYSHLDSGGATFAIENTIIAGNTATSAGADIYRSAGTFTPTAPNLIGNNDTASSEFPAGPLVGSVDAPLDPLLGPPANNGGTTQTLHPLAGSPAIDAGGPGATTADQRRFPRPSGPLPDIGAVEVFAPVSYVSAAQIPLGIDDTFPIGGPVSLALGFSPAAGTEFMVVENSGMDFIQGEFSNLPNGGALDLEFEDTIYPFVAWYHGGDGNDLVLIARDSGLAAWGSAYDGSVPPNPVPPTPVPSTIDPGVALSGKTVVAIATGAYHSLVLCSDGTLAAWGNNVVGQLGDNSTTDSPVPVAVDRTGVLAGKTVVAVAAGAFHNLVLCSDGTLAAWGNNGGGQLGDDSTTDSPVPVAVDRTGVLAGKKVVALAAGNSHSVALCADGTLAAWGDNSYGQLGNGSNPASPVAVEIVRDGILDGKTIVSVAAGSAHNLAICSDGTLVAWGDNASGQLGDGFNTIRSVPVPVDQTGVLAGKSVIDLAAGQSHSLVLCADGTLATWGSNVQRQLGDGSNMERTTPVNVDQSGVLAGKTVVAVAAGNAHSLTLCSDGTLAAWGSDFGGQLGDNGPSQSLEPASVPVSVSTAPGTSALSGRFVTRLAAPPGGFYSLVVSEAFSSINDEDEDGLNDLAESLLGANGFHWQLSQPDLVADFLSQTTLFTKSQFDAHGDANFAAGEANVTGDPNAFDLYNLSQIQALHVGAPLIQRQPDGQFKLTIGIAKSADLNPPFLAFPFTAPGTTINPQGEIEFLFASPDDAAFFRLESR